MQIVIIIIPEHIILLKNMNQLENNNNEINEENRMKMFNNNKNKLFNFAIDKNPNNNYINKELIKKNTSPFIMDNITKNKQNGAIRNFHQKKIHNFK